MNTSATWHFWTLLGQLIDIDMFTNFKALCLLGPIVIWSKNNVHKLYKAAAGGTLKKRVKMVLTWTCLQDAAPSAGHLVYARFGTIESCPLQMARSNFSGHHVFQQQYFVSLTLYFVTCVVGMTFPNISLLRWKRPWKVQPSLSLRIMAHFSHCAFAWYIVGHLLLAADSLGPLPDASQEGLLWPWKGYSSVALFHYHVPKEATRATWEFASFQDAPDCPKRQVHVWIQYGSYPVINASSVDEFPTSRYYTERSNLEWLTLESAHKPADSVVHPG
jgi:hypothetical protein